MAEVTSFMVQCTEGNDSQIIWGPFSAWKQYYLTSPPHTRLTGQHDFSPLFMYLFSEMMILSPYSSKPTIQKVNQPLQMRKLVIPEIQDQENKTWSPVFSPNCA